MILSRYYTLANLYTLINLLILSIVIYCGVDVFYTIAGSKLTDVKVEQVGTDKAKTAPRSTKRRSFSQYLPAVNRNLFGAPEIPVQEPKEVNIADLEPTALKISLLGTISGDKKSAAAIIQEKSKRTQSLYRVGDTVAGAKIEEILRAKVILLVGNDKQILTMEEEKDSSKSSSKTSSRRSSRASPGRPRLPGSQSPTTITLNRETINRSLEDITEIMSQVRVRPHFKDGKTDGFMLSQVKPNSIFTRLGLRNGDVIQGVDGEEIESPEDVMDFYEELKEGTPVSLEIMRRGKKKDLTYKFK